MNRILLKMVIVDLNKKIFLICVMTIDVFERERNITYDMKKYSPLEI